MTRSPTAAIDERNRVQTLDRIRHEGVTAAGNGSPALVPSVYLDSNEQRDAWIDGYLDGIKAKGKAHA